VFRDSVSVETSPDQVDLGNSGAGTLLQLMLRGYLRACALHREGNLTDEEYALWKSKSPAYLEDCREIFPETVPVPEGKTQEPAHKRKRKINNGH
jgi:hypothetical protein